MLLKKLPFFVLGLSAATLMSAAELLIPAGTTLQMLSLNTVEVSQGQQVEAILKPLPSASAPLPEYCILSARLSLTANGGLLTTDNMLCVTDDKQVLRASWQQLVVQQEQATIELDCVSADGLCSSARLLPGREFSLVLQQDLRLVP